MRHSVPSTATLLKLLSNIRLRIVEAATIPVHGPDHEIIRRRIVRGYALPENMLIVLSKRHHRGWAKADDMVLTFIHELLHVAVPKASERWVRAHEMVLYKDPVLREAVAIRMLNELIFPDAG